MGTTPYYVLLSVALDARLLVLAIVVKRLDGTRWVGFRKGFDIARRINSDAPRKKHHAKEKKEDSRKGKYTYEYSKHAPSHGITSFFYYVWWARDPQVGIGIVIAPVVRYLNGTLGPLGT